MTWDTTKGIIVGATILAGAMLATASLDGRGRYQIAEIQAGGVARLDTRTGEVVACMIHQTSVDEETRLTYPCDGSTN